MVSKIGLVTYDPDAQALFDAAQITNSDLKEDVNTLIVSAKANGWWDLCIAIYGFAGDNVLQTYASQYKFNWKDPQDTDAAFRLSFTGGWSFDADGATGNGTSGYADTHIIPSTDMTIYDSHMSVHIRNDVAATIADLLVIDGTNRIELISNWNDDSTFSRAYTTATGILPAVIVGNSIGYWSSSITASNAMELYRNGSSIASTSSALAGSLPSLSLPMAAANADGVYSLFSNREYMFMTIGSGIDDSMAAQMYTDINVFQTARGRNV